MSLSKEQLVSALLELELFPTESEAIAAWATAWKKFFSGASANYNQADPSYVSDQVSSLKIGVNSVVGSSNVSGSWVKVECLLTGFFEVCEVAYDTQNYIETSDLLGQEPSPSTVVTDYEVTDSGIIVSALSVPEAAMVSAMVGLSEEGEAGNKLQNGLEAWWNILVGSPGVYFKDAVSIGAPSGISGLSSGLDSTFDSNLSVDPPITKEAAINNVADDFIAANTGGTVTIGAVTKEIE